MDAPAGGSDAVSARRRRELPLLPMTTMLLVRHGQSEWNAAGRWQGQADPPLSDLGRQQAFSAGPRIGSVDVIVSSDLQRSVETAQIISAQIGVGPVVVEPGLKERDAGAWSGLTGEQIDAGWPGFRESGQRPDGWESDADLLVRVLTALDAIAREYDGAEVLVITHGGVVYALEGLHGLPFAKLPNLGGRQLVHHGDRVTLGDRILLVDDDAITTVPAQI
jgi:broad specificity phosphatase PhoE